MPKKLSEAVKGEIRGYFLSCNSRKKTAEHFKVGVNTVTACVNKTRRTDMDKHRRKKKSKAHITTRRAHIKRIHAQTELLHYTAGKRQKPCERRLPKHASCSKMRQWFITNNRAKKAKKQIKVPSLTTIRRDLKSLGLKCLVRPRVPFTKPDVVRRKKFVSNPDFRKLQHVKKIMFSDEHYITSNDTSCRSIWVKNVRDLVPRETKSRHNTVCSQLWAMIGFNYKSPIIWVDFKNENGAKVTRMNAKTYIDNILKHPDVMRELKNKDRIFQQDGARCHQAKDTKMFLDKKKIIYINDWPANSPDLNPIEQVWALLNQRVAERRGSGPADDVAELRRIVEEEWAAIPQSVINNYVTSFMSKCERCRRNNGGTSKK